MILYHGSNVEVRNPKILESKRLLDFGTGFYLTSDYEQAKKWAIRTTARRENGISAVSVYHAETNAIQHLKLLTFEQANYDWLRYISANRTNKATADLYDIVIGPVANDQAIRTINNYLKGYFSEEIAIQLLLPQKLKDQYAFKTERALSILTFCEVNFI